MNQADGATALDTELDAALARVKPSVRAMGAYTLKPYEPRIKLNQNESPYDVPDAVKARIAERLKDRPWNRYPPFVARGFISAVAEATGWAEDGILVANGSNELIQAILAVTVSPGTHVVIPEPTFTLYRLMTEVNGGTVASVPLTAELRFDVDGIIRAARMMASTSNDRSSFSATETTVPPLTSVISR